MKKRLLYVLFAVLVLSGCSQGAQVPASEPASAPVSEPVSASVAVEPESTLPVRPDPTEPFAEKQAYPDAFKKINFDESKALEIGVNVGQGDGQIRQFGSDLFIFNDPANGPVSASIDANVDFENCGVYQVDTNAMTVTRFFQLPEQCKVLFTESGFLALYGDRIERYSTSFELIETIAIPENSLYPHDIYKRPCVLGDENHIIFVPSKLTDEAYLLDLTTGEEQLWQVKATVDGQTIVYDKIKGSLWSPTNDPDVVVINLKMFVNWKTCELLENLEADKSPGVAASYSKKTKYLTGWLGSEDFSPPTIGFDGAALRQVDDANVIVDFVNETQLMFSDYSYGLSAVYRTADDETFYLLHKSMIVSNIDPEKNAVVAYLYQAPK